MSVYRVIDVIGTSSQSWEDAAATAVNTARKSLRDLRVAEVVEQDLNIGEGGELIFRTKLRLSFKYEDPAVSRPSDPVRGVTSSRSLGRTAMVSPPRAACAPPGRDALAGFCETGEPLLPTPSSPPSHN